MAVISEIDSPLAPPPGAALAATACPPASAVTGPQVGYPRLARHSRGGCPIHHLAQQPDVVRFLHRLSDAVHEGTGAAVATDEVSGDGAEAPG